jgi:hypothetical protein
VGWIKFGRDSYIDPDTVTIAERSADGHRELQSSCYVDNHECRLGSWPALSGPHRLGVKLTISDLQRQPGREGGEHGGPAMFARDDVPLPGVVRGRDLRMGTVVTSLLGRAMLNARRNIANLTCRLARLARSGFALVQPVAPVPVQGGSSIWLAR